MAITRDPDGFNKPISEYMSRRLDTVLASDSVDSLLPIFRADRVAIVMDNQKYLGLITRIDLISYLRKRMST